MLKVFLIASYLPGMCAPRQRLGSYLQHGKWPVDTRPEEVSV